MNQEFIDTVRKTLSNSLAKELCEVQPMPNDIFTRAMIEGKSEEWLIANGYEPVDSQTRMMWVKKNGDRV